MKSLLFLFLSGLVVALLAACQVKTTRESIDTGPASTPTLVDPKYSLSKDRSELDKLRDSVPVDIKKTNDEKALMAEWFVETKYEPEKIRDKFDTLVRKKRELFNKDMTKQRDQFNKDERSKRSKFLKELEDERKSFMEKKVDRDRRSVFFNEQDERRKNFLADLKDKREEFEGVSREKRKDFEDYIKEKQNDFNTELKAYREKWKEKNAR